MSNGTGTPSDRPESRGAAPLALLASGHHRLIPAITLAVCLIAAPTQARGLLGLFAGESDLPAPAPVTASPAPIDPGRPVAWVSALRGVTDPAAQLYGYVNAGTSLDLGAQGEITLTYLSPCREESINGGIVKANAAGPQVSGAPPARSRALSCRPIDRLLPGKSPSPRMSPEGPFDPRAWYEVTINSAEPVFRWDSALGAPAQLAVIDLDAEEPREIWSAKAYSGSAAYPHEAAPIQPGRPYLIRATLDDGARHSAVFSYDPDLSYSSALVNALVPLRPTREAAP